MVENDAKWNKIGLMWGNILFVLFAGIFVYNYFIRHPNYKFGLIFIAVLFFALYGLYYNYKKYFANPTKEDKKTLIFIPLTLILIFTLVFGLIYLVLIIV